jgi:hypothetical protein
VNKNDLAAGADTVVKERKLERSQVIRGILGPILGITVLIVLLWPHFDEILEATELVSTRAVIALAVLHLAALLLRAQAWGRCVEAAGAPIDRKLLHSSSSLRFLADTLVPTYVGAWVRIGLVKRFDRFRAATPGATPSPTIGQMFTADGLMLLVEAFLTIGLIIVAVLTSSLQWWWVVVFSFAVAVVAVIARWAFAHFKDREFARTARVLSDSRDRLYLAGLLAIVLIIQPVRFYMTYKALGLDPSASDALLGFLLTTVFNALPIGPGPSSIAASATLFSGSSIDKTASAGFVLLGTAVIAAFVYSLWGAAVLWKRWRLEKGIVFEVLGEELPQDATDDTSADSRPATSESA